MSTNATPTPPVSCVDTNSRSTLPSGSLKFENGQLFLEATVIVHRGPDMGCHSSVWLPVPEGDRLLAAIRASGLP
jgi:hypothetical protein